ncbi:glucosyltransferase domain-containing protein [Pseudomonas typographi]|uniref:glucosyltransferase domain-containing protein n=1 Tax=Pseudomonas typographi TaxID=2715964 RepID=UPI0016891F9D|nr:glucosyltransferase domain-containing protein [Pseudomonas typographi]MBD1554988.1 hypothetical protein [Pseudomonas typographi]MBD1588016.1 hypothetical protein [Pseudomonas typographi]
MIKAFLFERYPGENPSARWRSFFIIGGALLAVASPLFSANAYYRDDFFRAIGGNVQYWTYNGRPLATWLFHLLNFSATVSDTSPLPLLLGMASIAAALAISAGRLTGEAAPRSTFLALSVVFCPFLVQPMLYAYDALPISLSVALVFLAMATCASPRWLDFLICLALFIAAACLYQTAANYACIAIVLLAMGAVADGRAQQPLQAAAIKAAALGCAVLVYKLAIFPLCATDEHNFGRGQLLSLDLVGLRLAASHVRAASLSLLGAFPGYSVLPVAALLAAGALACWRIGLREFAMATRAVHVLRGLFAFGAPVLVYLSTFGLLLLLKTPAFEPRVLAAFSAAVLFNACMARKAFPRFKPLISAALILHLMFSVSFMMSSFRALINQNNFDQGVALALRAELSRTDIGPIDGVSILGNSPAAPDTLPVFEHYPLLRQIIFPAFSEHEDFAYYAVMNRALAYYPYIPPTAAARAYIPSRVLSANCIYRFYVVERTAFFDFTTPRCTLPRNYLDMPPTSRP